MVFVRLFGVAVFPETLALFVVVVIDTLTLPRVVALDAEVIVRLPGQFAGTCRRFEQPLGKRDAGRYLVALLVVNGDIFVLVDVIEIYRVFRLGRDENGDKKENPYERKAGTYIHILGHKIFLSI